MDSLGFDVFQEVRGPLAGDGVADIVARRGPALVVVECKMSLGLDVMAQALRWNLSADYCIVACPQGRGWDRSRSRRLAERVLRGEGLGFWSVDLLDFYGDGSRVREIVRPRRNRRLLWRDKWLLCPEQKTWAEAGNADGKAWSPWRRTQSEVNRVVREKPGMLTREVVEAIDHHYASDYLATRALPGWVRGVCYGSKCLLPEIEVRKERGKFRWYTKEAPNV